MLGLGFSVLCILCTVYSVFYVLPYLDSSDRVKLPIVKNISSSTVNGEKRQVPKAGLAAFKKVTAVILMSDDET